MFKTTFLSVWYRLEAWALVFPECLGLPIYYIRCPGGISRFWAISHLICRYVNISRCLNECQLQIFLPFWVVLYSNLRWLFRDAVLFWLARVSFSPGTPKAERCVQLCTQSADSQLKSCPIDTPQWWVNVHQPWCWASVYAAKVWLS